MKLRKNKTTPKSCQITIGDDICISDNNGAGWKVNDDLVARVVKGKHGKSIEIMRSADIMAFMTKN